jgi:hypothetical protein
VRLVLEGEGSEASVLNARRMLRHRWLHICETHPTRCATSTCTQSCARCRHTSTANFTYFVDTILVHQGFLVDPVNIEGTNLEQEVQGGLWFGRTCDRSRSHGVRSIVRAGGNRLLRGRNKRHALEESFSLFFLSLGCRQRYLFCG